MTPNNGRQKGFATLLALGAMLVLVVVSCSKWVDPKPIDLGLTNPYCNDPNAVNYNWGFPGKPDNTVCFYPTDVFKGKYVFIDSIYSESGSTAGNFLYAKIDTLYFIAISQTKLVATGFCGPTDSMHLTAVTFTASVDTLAGDSLTATQGQITFCRTTDTVNGSIFYNRNDSLLHVNFQVTSDTGISQHIGKARKQ